MYLFYHTSKTQAQSVSAGHQKHQHHAMIFIVSQLQDDTEDGDLLSGQPLPQAEARPPHQRGVHTARRPHRAHQHRHHRGRLQVSRYLQYLLQYLQKYQLYREVGAVLTRRLYNIYKYDFELFGYKADKYLSRD